MNKKVCLFLSLFIMIFVKSYGLRNRNKAVKKLFKIASKKVFLTKKGKFLLFESGMSINADGSPKAYHPQNIGLDDLAHAGKNGYWWALVTHNRKPAGTPLIQTKKNPAPGYYISTTSLFNRRKKITDPYRYVNAVKIPFIALPLKILKSTRIRLGDLAFVYHKKNKRYSYAIFADVGSNKHIGEGSIALAKKLKIPSNPRWGGVNKNIVYLIFPKSGLKRPLKKKLIIKRARKIFIKWGGLKRFKRLIKKL